MVVQRRKKKLMRTTTLLILNKARQYVASRLSLKAIPSAAKSVNFIIHDLSSRKDYLPVFPKIDRQKVIAREGISSLTSSLAGWG